MKFKTPEIKHVSTWAIVALLVALVAISRIWFADIPNFKPVAAVGLFAGFLFFRKRIALALLFAGLIISDFYIGTYSLSLAIFVYGGLLVSVLLGARLNHSDQTRPVSALPLVTTILVASLVFFFVSNFGFWLTTGIYTKDLNGLWLCFVNAIPFFKYTLAGDAIFGVSLFGLHAAFFALQSRAWLPLMSVERK